jgi:hypothetical protein
MQYRAERKPTAQSSQLWSAAGGKHYRMTRAPVLSIAASTSFSDAIKVSLGVVMASAP